MKITRKITISSPEDTHEHALSIATEQTDRLPRDTHRDITQSLLYLLSLLTIRANTDGLTSAGQHALETLTNVLELAGLSHSSTTIKITPQN